MSQLVPKKLVGSNTTTSSTLPFQSSKLSSYILLDKGTLRKKISASVAEIRQSIQDYNQEIKDYRQEQRDIEEVQDFMDFQYYIASEQFIVEDKKCVKELKGKKKELEQIDVKFVPRLEELNTIISRDYTNGSE